MLVGHEQQQQIFATALHRGQLHHAWLITGPKGIGKRLFADWAATLLLGGDDERKAAPVRALMASQSHPDFRLLEPPSEGKGSATSSIPIEDVRNLQEFLHGHPSLAGRLVLLVDSIDDMNRNAANAFLKELEEPGAKTVYLLVSHAPGRLLPTIRSRCRTLRLKALADRETTAILQSLWPDLGQADLATLARLAEGAPGRIAALGATELLALNAELDRIEAGKSPAELVRGMQPQSAAPKFAALLSLLPQRLLQRARAGAGAPLFPLYDEAQSLAADAIRLAYDRQQVAWALANLAARAGRIQERT